MKHRMRRIDRALPESDIRELLQRGENGVLLTVSGDGQPYGVPVSYVYAGDAIYVHCATEGHKLENIAANARVAFCVVGRTEVLPAKFATKYESAIVFGTATEVSGEEKQTGLVALLRKYSSEFMDDGLRYIEAASERTKVYKITIEGVTEKARK